MKPNELIADPENMGFERITATLIVQQLIDGSQADLNAIYTKLGDKQNVVVLRDEDVDLVKLCAEQAASFVAAASVGAWAPGLIASLVILLYRIRRRSFEVTTLQGAILESIVGTALTPAQISDTLGLRGVDESIVSQELAKLTEVARTDGVRFKLAVADQSGRWLAQGI